MFFPLIRWTPNVALAAMLVAMLVFGANFAFSRYGIQHGLTPYDLTFLRFGPAGLLLLPVFLRMGVRGCAGLGWRRGLLLALTGGFPVTVLMSLGASLAPAAHGAALAPGTVTVVGVVYAILIAGRLPSWLTRTGLVLATAGLATIAAAGSAGGSGSVAQGDLFFFATGLIWGFYPILLHRWRVGAMTGAVVCAVLSTAYVPAYFAVADVRLLHVPPGLVLAQALYQGVLNSILGLWLWGQGVRVLGAGGTQFFPPLLPVIGTVAAIPILGEWPGPLQSAGVSCIVVGIAMSAFGNRPGRPADPASSTPR